MAEIKVELSPESIEKEIVAAIIQSGIGKELNAAIARVIPKLREGWDNSFDKFVKDITMKYVAELLEKEYFSMIEAEVRRQLTPELITKLVSESLENLKYRSRY